MILNNLRPGYQSTAHYVLQNVLETNPRPGSDCRRVFRQQPIRAAKKPNILFILEGLFTDEERKEFAKWNKYRSLKEWRNAVQPQSNSHESEPIRQ